MFEIVAESDLVGGLLSILAAIIGGAYIIPIRKATASGYTMEALIGVIWINAIVFLLLSILFCQNFEPNRLTINSLLIFAAAGITGTCMGRIFQYLGIEKLGASRTEPISKSYPLVATALAISFLGEQITAGHVAGIFMIVSGIMLIINEIGKSENSKTGLGWAPSLKILYPLGSMLFFGLEAPLAKIGLSEGVPVLIGLSIKFLTALVTMVGYFLLTRRKNFFPFGSKVKERNLFVIAGLMTSAMHGLRYLALSMSRVVVVEPFLATSPLFVLLFSYFLIRSLERITIPLILGSMLVVGGTIFLSIFM